MIDFATLQGLTIPEGVATQITDESGRVIWAVQSGEPIVLEVKKKTLTTYANETTYTDENFVLLDIYPKTANSKVNVTYGGLTKTLTFSGTNAQQVFFGTFNGVSDEVTTPASGTLTIEGDCKNFAVGTYKTYNSTTSKTTTNYCGCITAVSEWGNITGIVAHAFDGCRSLESISIPDSVTSIASQAFYDCSKLTSLTVGKGVASISGQNYGIFKGCNALTNIEVDTENTYYSADGSALLDKNKTQIIEYAKGLGGNYTISNSVVSIGDQCFYEIASTVTITVPSSVSSIGDFAFYKSGGAGKQQTNVVMMATIPPVLGSSVFNFSSQYNYGNITVPKGCGNTYKTAEGWSSYADYITEVS